MGKSSSKLSLESFETRIKQATGQHVTANNNHITSNGNITNHSFGGSNNLLNEKSLHDLCKGFNREFPDTQLANVLDDEHLLATFLTDIFYNEVRCCESMQTLFRGNCLASKIMSHCFRTFGSHFLKQLLEPHIEPLLNQTVSDTRSDKDFVLNSPSKSLRFSSSSDATANIENTAQHISMQPSNDSIEKPYTFELGTNSPVSYEIDSKKLEDHDDIDMNQKNLLKLTKQILDSILSSADSFPPQLKSMCICLRQVLCEKYSDPNANLKAVGTVIFLRFINPAIVSPYEAGIVQIQPPAKTLRGLMLVSKILQNIANNVEFSKEEHMLPFNDFVRQHFKPMRQWVSEISTDHTRKETSNK